MNPLDHFDPQQAGNGQEDVSHGYSLTIWNTFCHKLARLFIRPKSLSASLRRFSHSFEFDLAEEAAVENVEDITLEMNDEQNGFESVYFGDEKKSMTFDGHQLLCQFFSELGISALKFDVRLEQNQIFDIVTFLYSCRHKIERFRKSKRSRALVQALMGKEGVHLACTRTRIDDSVLIVRYSYCTLQYSHLVHWFERRQTDFRDHRAMFRAAPRYAIFSVLFVMGGSTIYALLHKEWYLLGIISLAGSMLYLLVYLLFMVVGSIEYDNEEKAYRLKRAFGQMKKYTSQIEADIQQARNVQQILLPTISEIPFQDTIDWAGWFMPTAAVGGDYYDVQRIDETRLALIFSDVCGHGLSAALITAVIKTTFQGCLDQGVNLEEIVEYLNLNLCRMTPLGSFAATFMAIYDTESHVLTYCNAGHQPEPWIIPADSEKPVRTLSDARFLLLGIKEDYKACYSQCRLEPGDKFIIVSDGITESSDRQGHYFGNERLEAILQTRRQSNPKDLLDQIFSEVHDFSRSDKCDDDCTMLAFEVKQPIQES